MKQYENENLGCGWRRGGSGVWNGITGGPVWVERKEHIVGNQKWLQDIADKLKKDNLQF